ncbi:RES family NAD+ phosphorylase [Arthrobacter sp. H14]|uniref:RES family NAD+ phosphorylase n=1 Tax=Arthrobacter sp. H14 TaxID=1312959 RepID=UPI0009DF1EBE
MTRRGSQPHLITPAHRLWRVAYKGNALKYPWIDPFQAESQKAGNRFDVPGGGVLYASSNVEGCFAETLARLRPSPAMLRLNFAMDPHHMKPGSIARDCGSSAANTNSN